MASQKPQMKRLKGLYFGVAKRDDEQVCAGGMVINYRPHRHLTMTREDSTPGQGPGDFRNSQHESGCLSLVILPRRHSLWTFGILPRSDDVPFLFVSLWALAHTRTRSV